MSGQEGFTKSVVAIRRVPRIKILYAKDPSVNLALKAASAREEKC